MMRKLFILMVSALFLSGICFAQERFDAKVELDKTIHNFGDILISDGPVSCSFKVKNISSGKVVIQSVTSTCGCTKVEWTRGEIAPGKTATVSATYTNDEGPLPFDKNLTMLVSGVSKPIILHLRGNSVKKKLPLDQAYPVHMGPLGLKAAEYKLGTVEQGLSVSDEFVLANISSSLVEIEFAGISDGLSLQVDKNPIPAGSTATVKVNVLSDKNRWGRNVYKADIVCGGKSRGSVSFIATTTENFRSWTQQQKDQGAKPMFQSSSFNYGKVKAGKVVEAVFRVSNSGKETLKIYKVDSDNPRAVPGVFPEVKPSGSGEFRVRFDTSGLPSGENIVVLTLVTNAPKRPVITLFLTGTIN